MGAGEKLFIGGRASLSALPGAVVDFRYPCELK